MTGLAEDTVMTALSPDLVRTRAKCRILMLLDASERAGITPLRASRFHALAYLADILSPVFGLQVFAGSILKNSDGPHYPDLQQEIDRLVIMGLVEILDVAYVSRGDGARVDGNYALRFSSAYLSPILAALGCSRLADAIDPRDATLHKFLVELAGALATIKDDEIDVAARVDTTYADNSVGDLNIIDFGQWTTDPEKSNLTIATLDQFRDFLPQDVKLSAGQKLYLYASFLGRKVQAIAG